MDVKGYDSMQTVQCSGSVAQMLADIPSDADRRPRRCAGATSSVLGGFIISNLARSSERPPRVDAAS